MLSVLSCWNKILTVLLKLVVSEAPKIDVSAHKQNTLGSRNGKHWSKLGSNMIKRFPLLIEDSAPMWKT